MTALEVMFVHDKFQQVIDCIDELRGNTDGSFQMDLALDNAETYLIDLRREYYSYATIRASDGPQWVGVPDYE
jgi:hypothetical protein